MTKLYCYNNPKFDPVTDELIDNEVVKLTKEQVLAEYWDYWKKEMEKSSKLKNTTATLDRITEENCLDDFLIAHWCWIEELK